LSEWPEPLDLYASESRRTALDESNVRKAFNGILEKAELRLPGPHQMRHTFASLALQNGAPITYVSRQLAHKDSAITLRVYAHWLPDGSTTKVVDALDDETAPRPDVCSRRPVNAKSFSLVGKWWAKPS
jgi:integrase